jgi:hypothetical protein
VYFFIVKPLFITNNHLTMVATAPARPVMFVSRDQDHKWIGNFLKKKHLALSHLIGKPETTSLYFSLNDFSTVIDRLSAIPNASGVKLYFASYCTTGNADVDMIARSGYMDQLTLLFAATDNLQNDLGQYFLIRPSGGVLFLTVDVALTLVRYYQTDKMPFLVNIIKGAGLSTFQETKALWYPLADFNGPYDMVKEMKMQNAAGVTAFIGSYGQGETVLKNADGTGGTDVSWQMNLVFGLVGTADHNGATYYYHFDLEDTPDWNDRPDPSDDEGLDTANPCPPAVCGSGLG